ncbi:MAG: hypothetical protein JXA18_11280 [Chitinispirillaceae bacterium]|nr:hypothetical protein [Chitinispirillaceae bacterium]
MKYGTLLLLAAAAFLGYQCQITLLPVTGVEPVKTNISGVILQPDGITPAAGTRVMLYPADLLFFPQETGLGKTFVIRDTTLTDDEGVFTIDTSIKKGFYLIEAMSKNDIVLIDSIELKEPDQTITTPPATLKPAGAVSGSVVLSGGGNYRDVFVLAFGIDRFTQVKEDGNFCFNNLGEGTYSIRIVSLMDDYGVFDTAGVTVLSADTTDLGEIVLPFDGIPIPRNLSFTYDTLAMKVTLRWNRCNAPNVKGYAVYRRFADSNMVLSNIARQFGGDTVMIDSAVMQDYRYEYRVAAIGINDEEGIKSDGVIVTAASYFSVDTVFNLYESEVLPGGGIAVSGNGDLYFMTDECIQVFDRDMHFKRRIGNGCFTNRGKIDVDKNGWVFVLCIRNGPDLVNNQTVWRSVLYIIDDMGTIVDSIADSTYSNSKMIDFDVKGGRIYGVTHYNGESFDSVTIYTYGGAQLRAWRSEGLKSLAVGGDDKIYAMAYGHDVIVFDTLGNTLSTIDVPGIGDLEYDAERELLYILSDDVSQVDNFVIRTVLYVLDRNNILTATFNKIKLNAFSWSSYFKLSGNGDIVIYYYWHEMLSRQNVSEIIHAELIRLNPLNR